MNRVEASQAGWILFLGAVTLELAAACGGGGGPAAAPLDGGGGDDAPMDAAPAPSGDSAPPPSDAGTPPNINPCRPFTMPPATTLFGSNKRVFAHYFYPFPLSIDDAASQKDYYETQYLSPAGEGNKWLANGGFLRQRPLQVAASGSSTWRLDNMKREVELAIAAGITGFTVDILDANQAKPGSQLQTLLAAAAAVDARFKIVVMPDLAALGANQTAVQDVIASVANDPAAYHLPDGRLVVSAFAAEDGSVSFWTTVFANLAAAGTKVAFVPTFLGWAGYAASYAPISYGFADWGTATPSAAAGQQTSPAAAHADGKIFMMPVDPQQYRPKDFIFWEAGNSLAFRNAWTSAIAGGSDWVQLVTWSDFSESSEIEPSTDATLAGDIGTGFYDLNAYYASWFLTGQAPTLTEDALFYVYRREPTGAAAPAQTQPTKVVLAGGGPAQDDIELLGFLTAPGTLRVSIHGQTFTKDAPAGITSFTVPLQPGTPTFALERGGTEVFAAQGKVPIYGSGGLPSGTLDLTYWSGSASAAGTCELSTP
jgi:hypothetical protein